MLYPLLRELLFLLPPEASHHLSMHSIAWAGRMRLSGIVAPSIKPEPVKVMGIDFPNPVGLAAGLDKNGDYIDGLAALGFGFVEVGTVTPRPQPGNPQPRLFRLPKAGGIINRMGFNNYGVDHLVQQVQKSRFKGVLGINIGKNFDTPVERAVDDYLICLQKVYAHASYVVVNISSPNTKGLRSLQAGGALAELLAPLKAEQKKLAAQHGRYVPLAVKIAPDLSEDEIQTIANVLIEQEIDGVIATNTTLSRVGVEQLPHGNEQGGLSGRPVREISTRTIRSLAQALGGKLPIIGVGGIGNGESAAEKIAAGASLVQVYTGFIYRGPDLIGEAVQAIRQQRSRQEKQG